MSCRTASTPPTTPCSRPPKAQCCCCCTGIADSAERSRMLMARGRLIVLLALVISLPAFGDEGMWTYHDFPHELLKRRYGLDITPAWLERLRLATVRLATCSASFVSRDGLILTNHHCAQSCLDENSTHDRNLLQAGFL